MRQSKGVQTHTMIHYGKWMRQEKTFGKVNKHFRRTSEGSSLSFNKLNAEAVLWCTISLHLFSLALHHIFFLFLDFFLSCKCGWFQFYSIPSPKSENHLSVLTVFQWSRFLGRSRKWWAFHCMLQHARGIVLSTFLSHIPLGSREPQWPLTGIFWTNIFYANKRNVTKCDPYRCSWWQSSGGMLELSSAKKGKAF